MNVAYVKETWSGSHTWLLTVDPSYMWDCYWHVPGTEWEQ